MSIARFNHSFSQIALPNVLYDARGVGLGAQQGLFASSLHEAVDQVRSEIFLQSLPKNSEMPSLKAALRKIASLPQNRPELYKEVHKACFKQNSYFSRLFSGESWSEWMEHRTALGKVVGLFDDFIQSRVNERIFVKRLDQRILTKANDEAKVLLKRLKFVGTVKQPAQALRDLEGRSWTDLSSLSPCTKGVAWGAVGSVVTQSPVPLFMGLGGCLPVGEATPFPIGEVFNVSTVPTDVDHAITAFSNGNFVVAWYRCASNTCCTSNTCPGYAILGQIYNATGSAIGSNFQVNTFLVYHWPPQAVYHPSAITALSNDNFVVAWVGCPSNSCPSSTLLGQIYNATGSVIGSNFQVNTNSPGFGPAIAALNNGNFVVVWPECASHTCYEIVGQIYNATGALIGSNFQVSTINGEYNPASTALSNGNFVVAWSGCASFPCNIVIFGQMYNAKGSVIGSNFQINTFPPSTPPAVAAFSNGNFAVAWVGCISNSCPTQDIVGQMYNATGSVIGSNFQISTFPASTSNGPVITALSSGNVVIAWYGCASNTCSTSAIVGQMYNATGSVIGGIFNITTFPAGGSPVITALSNGNFVIVWNGCASNSCSAYDILGQIYSSNISALAIASTGQSSSSSSSTGVSSTGLISVSDSSSGDSSSSTGNPSSSSSSTGVSSTGLISFSDSSSIEGTDSSTTTSSSTGVSSTGLSRSSSSSGGPSYSSNTQSSSSLTAQSSTALPSNYSSSTPSSSSSQSSSSSTAPSSTGSSSSSSSSTASSSPPSSLSSNQSTSSTTAPSSTGSSSSSSSATTASSSRPSSSSSAQSSSSTTALSSTGSSSTASSSRPSSSSSIQPRSTTAAPSSTGSSTAGNSSSTPSSPFPSSSSLSQPSSSTITTSTTTAISLTPSNSSAEFIFFPPTLVNSTGTQLAAIPIGNAFAIGSSSPTSSQEVPTTAGLSDGNFVVTWDDVNPDGTLAGVYGQIFSSNGTLVGSEFQVGANTTQSVQTVSGVGGGNFVITWQDNVIRLGQSYDETGGKVGSQITIPTNSSTSVPVVSGLSNGDFVVVWSGLGVQGQTYTTSGSKVGSGFQINTNTNATQNAPVVAGLNNGNFVVVWQSDDSSGLGISGQLFTSNSATIGPVFQVNTYTKSDQTSPSIAVLSNGNFVVVWQSEGEDGSGWGVYGQMFDASGVRVGDEFQVNTYTISDQQAPVVASLSDGGFVVRWQSVGQDGSSYGIYGQEYDANGAKNGTEFLITTYTDSQHPPAVTTLSNGNVVVTQSHPTASRSPARITGQIYSPPQQESLTSGVTSKAVFSGIVTGSVSGALGIIFLGIKILLNRLSAKNLNDALQEREAQAAKKYQFNAPGFYDRQEHHYYLDFVQFYDLLADARQS